MKIQDRRYNFMNQILMYIFKGNSISIKEVEKYALNAKVGLVHEPGVKIKDHFEILNSYGILVRKDGLYVKGPKMNFDCKWFDLNS